MPLEIRELVIKASVDNKNTSNPITDNDGGTKQKALDMNEIVEKVLEIIQSKYER